MASRFGAILVLLLVLVSLARAQNELGVSPPRLTLSGAPGQTVTTVVNLITTSAKTQEVDASVSDWTLDENGNLTFVPKGATSHSAADWIRLDSAVYSPSSTSPASVRLSVEIPKDPTLAGTYRAVVLFGPSQAAVPSSGVGVTVRTRVGLIVYVTISGTESNSSRLNDLYQDGDSIIADVVNGGNTVMRLSGRVEIRDQSGATLVSLLAPNVPILRGSERLVRFALPKALKKGYYVALALLKDSRGGLLTGQLPFEVN